MGVARQRTIIIRRGAHVVILHAHAQEGEIPWRLRFSPFTTAGTLGSLSRSGPSLGELSSYFRSSDRLSQYFIRGDPFYRLLLSPGVSVPPMAHDHGHLRTSDSPLQHSNFSSARSDYGTGSGFDRDPHHQVSVASFGGGGYPVPAHGGVPSLGAGQPRVALPPSVKLPPSMMSSYQPRPPQQQMMYV